MAPPRTGWNLGVADEVRGAGDKVAPGLELPNLAHCTVGVRVGSNADFTFVVDYLRIMEKP